MGAACLHGIAVMRGSSRSKPDAPTPLILLIDDHPLFCDGFAAMLRFTRPGWRLLCAGSISDAKTPIEEDQPALVIIDSLMADMGSLARLDRWTVAKPSPPRLIMSGRYDELSRVRARAFGAKGFVSKIENGNTIAEAMDAILAGGTAFGADRGEGVTPVHAPTNGSIDAAERRPLQQGNPLSAQYRGTDGAGASDRGVPVARCK